MFENLRWRITVLFVGLSATIYVTLSALGLFVFERGLTAALDKQLKVVLSEIGHALDIVDDKPKFRDWIRTVQTEPPRSLATIQLFDTKGCLLERYGASGVDRLFHDTNEFRDKTKSVRILVSPITHQQKVKGFVQIQLSTSERDMALKELRLDACLIGVLFLTALSATSYWIAARVTRPIQKSVEILRSFVADASHELNTPLTIAQARLEALERRLSKQARHEEDLSAAAKSLARLGHVVNDLLLLSEVEDPVRALTTTQVNLALLLQDLCAEMQERFKEKQITFTVGDLMPVLVRGNSEALHRLVTNILENALRYTDEGGRVHLALEPGDKETRIIVTDTGIGIPAESLPHVFDRFFRVDKSRSRASGGTGLGLAIAKAITDAHHGIITVESTYGQGSKFTIGLPVHKSSNSTAST